VTLIVAEVHDDLCFMVGDTLVTPIIQIKGNPIGVVNGNFHGLKIQILNDNTAIAFSSGNAADAALRIISDVNNRLNEKTNLNVVEEVSSTYRRIIDFDRSKNIPDCEFLVLQIAGGLRLLAHITTNEIKYYKRAYIGDPGEYKLFVEALKLHKPLPSTIHVQQPDGTFREEVYVESQGEISFAQASAALVEIVAQQRKGKAVGAIAGNVLRVVDARPSGSLQYLQQGELGVSLEEGQAGYSFLASNTGKRGIGLYYVAGKVGFLMIAGDTAYSYKEPADTMHAFIELARQRYGLELTGVT
jgi:hypothetical protein